MEYADPQLVVFKTPKPLLQFEDDTHVSFTAPMVFQIDDELLIIPAGFNSDADSVPKLPGIYLWLAGSGKRSAYGHDFLYSTGCPAEFKARGRRWADRFFWRSMICEGLDQRIADAKYLGVRLGGESHWEV